MGEILGALAVNARLVFNHHSLPYASSAEAVKALPDFLAVALRANRMGFRTILMDEGLDSRWFRITLAPGYFWQDWYNSLDKNGAERDLARAFLDIAAQPPLIASEDVGGDVELFDAQEVTSGRIYLALRAAAWYQYPLISFPNGMPWNQNPLHVKVSLLDEHGERQEERFLDNWFAPHQLEHIAEQLQKERAHALRTGMELWASRVELFPFLRFCGDSPGQLQNWSHFPALLAQVRDALVVLNRFAEKWQSGLYNDYTHEALAELGLPHKVSGESATVLQNPSKRARREFWLDDGRKAYFENHIKFRINQYRLHFFVDSHSRTVHIGYIGPHLPT